MRLRRLIAAAAGLAAAACAASASAQALFTRETLHGLVELRAGAASGHEAAWTSQGFGKTAFSGGEGKVDLSQAVVEWRPRFGFFAGAVVSGQYQSDAARPRFDLDEAYLKLRTPPSPAGRLAVRVGVFYPPVSLEHGGIGWTSTELLSASALDTWIGEEVKVGGAEVSFERRFGDQEVTATAAVFDWNDTSATLLSFRGWSLGEVRAGLQTDFRLPPLSRFMRVRQAPITSPMWKIDHRKGFYGRLEWRPPAPVVLHAFHYDNRGDRTSVTKLQWAWETRFDEAGLAWTPRRGLLIRAQGLAGRTWMGFATPQTWLDMSFRAAYVMATQDVGAAAVSLRLDAFDTHDHTWTTADDNDEHGWAATAGLRRPLTDWADLFVEAQRVESRRPSRALAGEAPHQVQTVVQTAVRLHF
jgi:hypothetical protein